MKASGNCGANMCSVYRSKPWRITAILVASAVISGCAAGRYGRLENAPEVTDLFTSHRVLEDHRYYFCGPEGLPSAILGLDRKYELAGARWTEFEATGARLKKWVDWFDQTFGMRTQYYPSGYRIRDDSGKPIGVWYSIWHWTVVEIGEKNQVTIYPPHVREPHGDPGYSNDRLWP